MIRTKTPRGGWRKSSRSDEDTRNCVEVAVHPAEVGVRDTKDREGGQLAVPGTAWRAFLDTVTTD
ncbi:DUF397 domain-containing protein [Amycolatopsis samaneae]|uniref:DUF397 domain-containing protein n=1 Tax=Amycolatopsis samaneae TaxID=664691 RepID=A0ABW5GL42_9PSEU